MQTVNESWRYQIKPGMLVGLKVRIGQNCIHAKRVEWVQAKVIKVDDDYFWAKCDTWNP